MFDAVKLLNFFLKKKIFFFSGVPDSVLKEFTNILDKKKINHFICVHEGSAIALNIGNFIATNKIGVTYLQNSGIGNIINPIVSIADSNVYNIPLILLIGWRGSPNSNDEPQHIKQGHITKKTLNLLNIKFLELSEKTKFSQIQKLITYSKKKKKIVALLVRNKTFQKVLINKKVLPKKEKRISKDDFYRALLVAIDKKTKIISSTGYISRKLYEVRNKKKNSKGKDLYLVGGMGHASSLSLGYSYSVSQKVVCIDGDGSSLMYLGSLLTMSHYGQKNLKYFILNNHCHESVGGQKTFSEDIDFKKLATSLNFRKCYTLKKKIDLKSKLKKILKIKDSVFTEVKINKENNLNLPRPENFKKILSNFRDG